MEKPELTIVIPAYNESQSLQQYIPELVSFCETNNFLLAIVNDGSKDNSKNILMSYEHLDIMSVIHHKVNRGYGGALKSGIRAVKTNYLITIDADGQHVLRDVKNLFEKMKETDADMIVGSRKGLKSASMYRAFGKFCIRSIAKFLMPINIHDINSGMKIYNTKYAQKYISLCPDSMAFSDTITLVFINFRHLVLEEPISILDRKAGKSTISTKTALETIKEIINIVVLFNPLKIFIPISLIILLISLGWGIPWILIGNGLSVGAMLGIITSILLCFIGLIAEQISLIRKSGLSE